MLLYFLPESAFSLSFPYISLGCCSYPYAYRVALRAPTMTSAFHVAKRRADGKQLAVSVVGTFITPNNIWVLLGRQKKRMDRWLSDILDM